MLHIAFFFAILIIGYVSEGDTMKKILTIMLMATTLSGCAMIVNGRNKTINLLSSTGEEAQVDVISASGVQSVMIPGQVTVPRANQPITINVKETKCIRPSTTMASEKVSMWFFGDLFMSIFGSTATTTDVTSGSMWNYDDNIAVPVYKKENCKEK